MIRAMLDTHAWLWAMTEPERLRDDALDLISDRDNTMVVSAVCSIEIAIKWRLGKLELPEPPETLVPSRLARDGFEPLVIEHRHALRVAALPLHHHDPFDRLLIAQAQVEDLPIITSDSLFDRYDVRVIAAA